MIRDTRNGLVLRRIVTGPLDTNCWIVHAIGSREAGWPLSDFPTIMRSVENLLTTHDPATRIHPGHGRSTSVGDELPHVGEWRRRGW